jgi:hypothetical protein
MLAAVLLAAPSTIKAQSLTQLKYKVVGSFSTIYNKQGTSALQWEINGPDGLAWDGSGIWVTSCETVTLAKFSTTGKIIESFRVPMSDGRMNMTDHLIWDGTYIWGVVHSMPRDPGPDDGRIIAIDTKNQKVVKTISLPFRDKRTMTPMGLAYDGKHFWTNDATNKVYYRIDAETGAGKNSPYMGPFVVQGRTVTPCGISWDEHACLWISDLGFGAYFQVDPKTKQIVSFLSPPDNPDPTKYGSFRPSSVKKLFTGMTSDGTSHVWVVDELEGNPLMYELDVQFPTTGPCAHPVATGKTCVPGGQPYCGKDDICWGDTSATSKTCHRTCTRASANCPAGSTCWTRPGTGDVCLPGRTDGGFKATCKTDGDCQSAVCSGSSAESPGFCTEACTPGAANACAEGYACQQSGGRNLCLLAAEEGGCTVGRQKPVLPWAAPAGLLLLMVLVRRRR